ncbi:putative DNA repair helicase RadD [Caprobacter fermentans]|uniref:Putative DNA repair helicase RadD n=1 Tax=Caproicibacter fermentans TaxID=2576756 RepID=A0A6N8HZM3_9FIRM|nr:DEAD/DEAH box helicase [Caproicibacter fermentans]MVB11159.1 putative DNA repair helicase RadD [Caproicibacter fermentans]
MSHELRPYQCDLIDATRQAYREGFRAPCIVLPCGGGKSVIVAEMARQTTAKDNRVLFLVHRQELCQQIRDTFHWWGVNMDLCRIGMVQTICRRVSKIHPPALIITDENHHSLARSYQKIYEAFPDARRVGVTATPVRLNGGGLGDVNDKLVIGVSTKWLIENGYLAPYEYYAPTVADLTGLHVQRGEYVTEEVVKKLNQSAIYGDVINYYRQLSDGKQAICYCASIEHSQNMAEQFNAAGITAAHIDGETPKADRERIIASFRDGTISILCNVDLISEGFDVPDCNTAILLRPTKSLTLYIQQSMRCMRYKPGKRAVIIDHVGNYARFGLPDMDRQWDLTPKKPGKKREISEFKIRQCPKCFYTHEYAPECPHCGFVYPVKARTLDEIKTAHLEQIKGIVLDYTTPEECGTMEELQAYAKKQGYKPGWAWYQAKRRGIV